MTATTIPALYRAPGRVNLIGEHTDYNLGFALPIALPQRTTVSFRPDDSGIVEAHSDREPGVVQFLTDTRPGDVTGWAAYIAGVVWSLREDGHPVPGGQLTVSGGVETGCGLASSAALECAVLGALLSALGLSIDATQSARIAQRAENDYVGAPTGLLDQLAILNGRPRQAQLIDFRDLSTQSVPFDPEASGFALLLINSYAAHQHAGGEYAARRASCERVAAALGVGSLREVQDRGLSALSMITQPEDYRRARHILTENQRVLDMADALRDSNFTTAGHLLTASQQSMRDDFEITTSHIDLIADSAVQGGALGARMTGGGFGGCVIALVPADGVDAVTDAVLAATRQAGYREPGIAVTHAGAGAGSPAGD